VVINHLPETGSKNKDFPISKNKEKRKNNPVSNIFFE
jgi:hypothetical protein